MTILKSYNT